MTMKTNGSLSNWAMQLTMESLDLPSNHVYPAFVFGTLTYVFILFCNMLLLVTIVITKSLHKPMFILLINLLLMDIIGTTAFFPQLVNSIVSKNRTISYPACFFQALLLHFYGTGNLLFLTAMAYDRYIAICLPLRYNSIMNSNTLITIIVLIWLCSLLLMVALLAISARFKICVNKIVDTFCNNPSLVKLICEDTSVNNYYGLFTIIFLQGGSLVVVIYTYIQILVTCVMTKGSGARGKALQTCGTHLVVFLFLELNTAISLIAHRFENVSPSLRRAMGVSVIVFPPILNPLIYGVKTHELRKHIIHLHRRPCLTK